MTITDRPRTRSLAPVAAGAALPALLLMLIGTYLDTPFKSDGNKKWDLTANDRLAELPLLVGFAAIGVAVIFGVVVAHGLRREPERTAVRSLIVATVGVASIAVFWTGLPAILAAGAGTLALDARARLERTPASAAVALALAALTIAAALGMAFAGKPEPPGSLIGNSMQVPRVSRHAVDDP